MIQRKTQNLAYWRTEYRVDESDHEFLYDTLADSRDPQRLDTLALAIIERRCRQEESRIRNELTRGKVYDPRESYQVGEDIVLPAFDFRVARVISKRAGENPEHGTFGVITVQFQDRVETRMFASELLTPHALNRDGQLVNLGEEELLSSQDIFDEVGGVVGRRIEEHLRANPTYFISAGVLWMTSDQMVEVNVGHLNIAEAAIEVRGGAISTHELMHQVELDPNSTEAVRIFSLENAMLNDERFVQVGSYDANAWYLRRLMPAEAVSVPVHLQYRPTTFDRTVLDVELMQTEWDVADELTQGGIAEESPSSSSSAVEYLIYPHMVAGTLPLPSSARAIFPAGNGSCTAITFIDGRWGSRFPGYVVHEYHYVAGLADWFTQHKLLVGARIHLERTGNPLEVVVDFKPVRTRREWIRTARVENGRLVFEMQRHQVSCDYDDHLSLVVSDHDAVAELAAEWKARDVTPTQLVQRIMPELTKLSPQGTAHVKSLYSAVNVVHRLPPGPLFAALVQLPGAIDTGSGFWSL